MTTIHLNEEQVQSLVSLIEHRLHDMDAACDNLERQQARLVMGWQSNSAVKFIADYRRIIRALRNEIEELNRLQFTLQNEVRQWMDADKAIDSSRQNWGQVLGTLVPTPAVIERLRRILEMLNLQNYGDLRDFLRANPLAPLMVIGTFPFFILPFQIFPGIKPPSFPPGFVPTLPGSLEPDLRRPEPLPSPIPTPAPTPTPRKPESEPNSPPVTPPTASPTPVHLEPTAPPTPGGSCAVYAQARRPDLGPVGEAGNGNTGAGNYIDKYSDRAFQISGTGDLRENIATGFAVVWEIGHPAADSKYGHVAIVEEVHSDHVIVSQAGRSPSPMRIERSQLESLYLIP